MVQDDTTIRGKSPILKNPSIQDYVNFKNNTKYKAIRGIGILNDIYVIDANSGIHDQLAGKVLEYLGYDLSKINIEDYITGTFKEDEHNNFSYSLYKENKKLEEFALQRNNVLDNRDNYFDYEEEYKQYEIENCDKKDLLSFDEWMKERFRK